MTKQLPAFNHRSSILNLRFTDPRREADVVSQIVLLVDDDENVLHGLARALRRQPYQLYTARSGDEAIAILKAWNVDVIVSDEQMPGISGSDLLAWVAENDPRVMRIVLTGNATAEGAIRAINEGAVYQFLTKPCDEVHLAITIRKALEHKGLLDEHGRLLERSRRQLSELARFNHDLGILTSIVSVDLQRPLQTIASCCRSLGEQYGDVLDAKARALTDDALDAVGEAQRLLARMLEHFGVDQERTDLAPARARGAPAAERPLPGPTTRVGPEDTSGRLSKGRGTRG
jgi:two-component system probable response regulator PhcQ